ncbi:MAG: phosphoadenosine phosphosulfate reductase family protein [Candidatus Marinimicrobia bacterium]|nr:phosphoadenosine phosphosulfate reductase family protein [Candidatus Neomarinimicrobiota bacterium]
MYKVIWDKELNGILLKSVGGSEIVGSARPVFFEELDLLGFDRFWEYPRCREPLLWAVGRQYYYRGEFVAEARGGNIFQSPEIVVTKKSKGLKLEAINIKAVIEKNKKALFVLENEALDFVEHTYNVYKKRGCTFAVAFSGGKDSQVVLDLVTRVVPPDDLVVIFSDTTMEISHTYENVEKTKEEYEKRYPGLKFYIAKPPKSAIEFWKEFGPPSVKQRWCCTVTKTAPFHKAFKKIYGLSIMKILVFEGCRSDESVIRARYERIRRNTKHFYQTNAEVIHSWNCTEVFLYLFLRDLRINKGYRYGLDRIGCSLCPFASSWNEHILYKIEGNTLMKFINVVYEYGKTLGLSNADITAFIADGQWKKRAGGRGIDNNGTTLLLFFKDNNIEATLKKPRENILEWFKTIGDLHYKAEPKNRIMGEIRIGNETLSLTINKKEENLNICINTGLNPITKEMIKKVLYKTTYCVHCGACAEECSTEALVINSHVKINTDLCTRCGNCLNFAEKGCLAAKSLVTYGGERLMKRDRIATSKFQNFGLRRDWLIFFLRNSNDWFSKTNLGNRQIESLKTWLRESELLDKNNRPAAIAKLLSELISNELLIWEIVWINLYYNVNLIKWYLNTFDWGTSISGKDLVIKLVEDDSNAKEKTAKNAISSLFNLFDCSPIGCELKIGVVEKNGRDRYIKKIGTDDIHPLAVAYSLYKVAEHIGRRDFTISELYSKEFKGGPYKLFGISRDKLERVLRGLQEDKEQILRVDLVADLDNIYLRDDLSSLDIVKIAEVRLK